MAELKRTEMSVKQEKAVLVGVILPKSTADPRDPLGELGSLAKTAGAKVVGQILQKRQRPDAGTYIGSGKAEEIAQLAIAHDADVVCSTTISRRPRSDRSKRSSTNTPARRAAGRDQVLDRSELILDIFATRARTHEAKLQVELAQMEYTYPRLMKMWGHLERIQSGAGGGIGIGTRGPGETQLETDRRIVRKRISDLKAEISKIQQRKTRLVAERTRQHMTVCIVGYTNAGKSTLFNTLTAAGTYADNKLFATLDTKTRAWKLERGTEVMLSDTVGFVRDLPHGLVASFKATLEEAVHADLLLHVLDVGHPHAQQQFDSVHRC
jgi:GTP-binding protein HflX